MIRTLEQLVTAIADRNTRPPFAAEVTGLPLPLLTSQEIGAMLSYVAHFDVDTAITNRGFKGDIFDLSIVRGTLAELGLLQVTDGGQKARMTANLRQILAPAS